MLDYVRVINFLLLLLLLLLLIIIIDWQTLHPIPRRLVSAIIYFGNYKCPTTSLPWCCKLLLG